MNQKLYPPHIESSLPAVIQGQQLIIPFQLNPSVSRNEFNTIAIIVKTVQTNTLLSNGIADYSATSINYDQNTGYFNAVFPSALSEKMSPGQYYKVQIAFAKKNTAQNTFVAGYYSSVGVIKCTTQPTVTIDSLSTSASNIHKYTYTGRYSQNGASQDKTEKVYSYRFDVYDEANKIIDTSGDMIHNSDDDTENYVSTDTWSVTKDLKTGHWYTIKYTVTTMNNLMVSSASYKIMSSEMVDFNLPAILSATMNFTDGFMSINLIPTDDTSLVRGSFVLSRSSEEDDYSTWQQLYTFNLVSQRPNLLIWQDYTVQQGMHYKYALQAFNTNGLYSHRIWNSEGPVLADFEDMFLFDGERQLNIRFNPKISSFKSTILESKIDTLGGKYPFIFRNGNVNYKEFPISGLISMLSDPNNKFMSLNNTSNINRDSTESNIDFSQQSSNTFLTAENYIKERQFKMEVLNWLNNGQPKLFRSPGEGNYIVRLMNVSLSPNDTLGRMLHTFSCTAYEIDTYTFQKLKEYEFISAPDVNISEFRIEEQSLFELFNDTTTPAANTNIELSSPVYYLSVLNQYTNHLVLEFIYQNGYTTQLDVYNVTGQYNIPINEYPITNIIFKSGEIDAEAKISYGYYDDDILNDFSYITDITVSDHIKQYIGGNFEENIIETLEDIRTQTGRFYYIKLTPRTVHDIYYYNGNYYKDKDYEMAVTTWDLTAIYRVVNGTTWLDGSPSNLPLESSPDFRAMINSTTYTDLSLTNREEGFSTSAQFKAITNIDEVNTLKIGSGVILDTVFQLQTLTYSVETSEQEVIDAKTEWLNAKKLYEDALEANTDNTSELASLKNAMEIKYNNYINVLEQALAEAQEGVINVI